MGSSFEELKLKEIKNGRLAMLSILGFFGQQAVTGMDPIDAWKAHLASPYENFIWANELVACSNGSGLCSRGRARRVRWHRRQLGTVPPYPALSVWTEP